MAASAACAGPSFTATQPVEDGKALFFELYEDQAHLPECKRLFARSQGMLAYLQHQDGSRDAVGTGCWVTVPGGIRVVGKSLHGNEMFDNTVSASNMKIAGAAELLKSAKSEPAQAAQTEEQRMAAIITDAYIAAFRCHTGILDPNSDLDPCMVVRMAGLSLRSQGYELDVNGMWIKTGK